MQDNLLSVYLESNSLIPALQSAYRRKHSTKTALLKICNEALMAADNGMVTLVVLLDYSSAFDTTDHSIMLDILKWQCDLTAEALQWHRSYLSCRSYAAVSGGTTCETVDLDCGLPQGSTLGPLKFVSYAADLHAVASRHVKLHSFAEDTQLYKHINIWDVSTKFTFCNWQSSVKPTWCYDMMLQLPDDTLTARSIVRNLGVQLDTALNFDAQARN